MLGSAKISKQLSGFRNRSSDQFLFNLLFDQRTLHTNACHGSQPYIAQPLKLGHARRWISNDAQSVLLFKAGYVLGEARFLTIVQPPCACLAALIFI